MNVIGGLEAGHAEPLGARCDAGGINFALFSANADKVELCLFDESGEREMRRLPLPRRTGDVWHGYLAGGRAGQVYGYRVHGPYAPERGHRFNAKKLLLDPYARDITGRFSWHPAHFDRETDSAPFVPKGVVTAPQFAVSPPLGVPWKDTVIYEMHVKGMTQRHPAIEHRGTFKALRAREIIDHLKSLDVTTVELLPVFAFTDETHLVNKGLTNYWGYNPISFFALEPRYGAGLADMVADYHAAGIEVILDVVYNHTGEGDKLGPTLSFRGIDNASYYWLDDAFPEDDVNYSGCGNTLNVSHPQVQRLVMDSLKHWAAETGVDGFRFDLAGTLARTRGGFCAKSSLLSQIGRDPELSKLKLIAEPWDLGGHFLGQLPPPWREWNDRYRDTARAFWRGDHGMVGRMATAVSGSSDVVLAPLNSINFVTAHDGFTLEDLVSYDSKHNAANGEENRDGTNHNLSCNYGAEGPTDNPGINAFRLRQKCNFIASLMLSQGVPMLLAGDEFGQTQGGNNNAYCQDNETTWLDWSLLQKNEALVALTRHAIAVRKAFPELRRDTFFVGDGDIVWLRQDGQQMTTSDWNDPARRIFGFVIADRLLVLLNASDDAATLPEGAWRKVLGTSDGAHSIVVMERDDV